MFIPKFLFKILPSDLAEWLYQSQKNWKQMSYKDKRRFSFLSWPCDTHAFLVATTLESYFGGSRLLGPTCLGLHPGLSQPPWPGTGLEPDQRGWRKQHGACEQSWAWGNVKCDAAGPSQGPTTEEAELGAAPDSPWTSGCRNSWVPLISAYLDWASVCHLPHRVLTDLTIWRNA